MRYWIAIIICLMPALVRAETLRIASFHTELSRDGPGLMLRDIVRGDDTVGPVVDAIARADADIIVLQGIDFDLDLRGITALRDQIGTRGPHYTHIFARPPNRGQPMGMDINGDGQTALPDDAQSYGAFPGQKGIAVLSRYPFARDGAQDFTDLLWADAAGSTTPRATLFADPEIWSVQRLSYTSHWALPIMVNTTRLTLLTCHASPPVFDGPEDRNGWRNHDETLFWLRYLDQEFDPAPQTKVVFAGLLNADPQRGEARKDALQRLLTDPRLQNIAPRADDGTTATAHWPQTGPMRVSYILPASTLKTLNSGQIPPNSQIHHHRLIWVDIEVD